MWARLHGSEPLPLLEGLIATAHVLAALSLLGWFGCYFRRRALLRREAREKAAETELTELIIELTARGQPDDGKLRNLARQRRGVLLRVLASLLEQVQGAGKDRLVALVSGTRIREMLHQALQGGALADRIFAAGVLGHFRDDPAASALTAALRDRNCGVRLAAARSLLNNPCARLTLREFLEVLRFSDRDPSIALADVFVRLPSQWHDEAIAMLREKLPANWRRMLAIALGRTRVAGALEAIASLLREDDPRLRAAAWIALAELGDDSAHAMLPQGLADRSADVRLAACHCARRLHAAGCVPALGRLLHSGEDWWVRYRAAQALAGMGASGRRAILAAAAESGDQAADVGLVALRECEMEAAHGG